MAKGPKMSTARLDLALTRGLAVIAVGLGSLVIGTTLASADTNENPASELSPLLSAEGFHSCVVIDGGTKCWGYNSYSQLGNGTSNDANTPTDVTGLGSGVTAITTGNFTSCAIVNTAAKCWGNNGFGQLGNGTSNSANTPIDVSGLGSGVTAISAGAYHTCAIVNSGAKCWGDNIDGQLGNGTYNGSLIPIDVSGLGSGVTAISAGTHHTCAIVNSGAVCWGSNSHGQLGNQSNSNSPTPTPVFGLGNGVTSISVGLRHTCATVNGAVKCWGWNGYGQLGVGNTTNINSPAAVNGLGNGATSVSAGFGHTCAIINEGAVCWGSNIFGQLGDQSYLSSNLPIQVFGLTQGVRAITLGIYHSCAVVEERVKCWGENAYGQLGSNSRTTFNVPVDVVGLATAFPTTTSTVSPSSTTVSPSSTTPNSSTSSTVAGGGQPPSNLVTVVPAGGTCNQQTLFVPLSQGAAPIVVGTGAVGPNTNPQGGSVRGLAYSPDGSRVYLARSDNSLVELDASSGQVLRTSQLPAPGRGVAVSPDGSTVYVTTSSDSSGLLFVDRSSLTVTANTVLAYNGRDLTPGDVVAAPDGSRVYVHGSWGGTMWYVVAIDTSARQIIAAGASGSSHSTLAISADGTRVFSNHRFSGSPSRIDILDARTMATEHTITFPVDQVLGQITTAGSSDVAFVADTTAAAVQVIDVRRGTISRTISNIGINPVGLAVTHDGSRLVAVAGDGYSGMIWRVVDVASGAVVGQGGAPGSSAYAGDEVALCPRALSSGTATLPTTGSENRGSTLALWLSVVGLATIILAGRRRRVA